MQLQFLGTGAGMPSKQRNTSSLALKLLEERRKIWLFDCGEATQHQILHTTLKPRKIEKIFITHLHGDHIFGLPGLLGSRSFLGGDEKLTIYGPKGLKEWIQLTLKISQTHLNYVMEIIEIEEGIIFEDDSFIVTAKELEHVIPCYGYRVEQKPLPGKLLVEKTSEIGVPKGPLLKRLKDGQDVTLEDGRLIRSADVTTPPISGFTVSILGDTRYCHKSIELSRDAHIVVHEATFDAGTEELAKPYGHSTILEAATVAKEAGAKALIANHISARFLPEAAKALETQGKSIFPDIWIASDFAEFEIKNGTVLERTS
ncbi:ribonuclease Z [Chungangia koreensis]|uniref:Ribonuclease Z n=1 Tax=Chungangia koreensis TaxID=752657 RepID=A0ABV8X9Y1_9LACT